MSFGNWSNHAQRIDVNIIDLSGKVRKPGDRLPYGSILGYSSMIEPVLRPAQGAMGRLVCILCQGYQIKGMDFSIKTGQVLLGVYCFEGVIPATRTPLPEVKRFINVPAWPVIKRLSIFED